VKILNHKLFWVIWILIVLIVVTITFAAAFYLTAFVYKSTSLNPPALLVQIINSFLGLIFTGVILRFFSQFFRARQFDAFTPIIAAMERIAQGDFNIRLDDDYQHNEIMSQLANSINKMALELNQLENMRQEFVSNVSHEIQSPLTSIRGFAQALRNDQLTTQDRSHYLDIIETESTRLSRLSDDLLKLTSLESEQAKLAPQAYRLDKQIRSLILTCEPQWTEKKIQMDVSLKEVSINGDANLLSQVWLNLIHNGIKFTPQNGSIRIELRPVNDKVEFTIADTGIGISVEDQVHIFERFYKADPSRNRSKGGSGLGLSIAKKIIEMHGGMIQVESQPGTGTTFTVSLPG
jgi:two-component system, OmpR family, phosphate regulon sensor histidine kinase PhoR